ncbi:MAG: single-stranded-DNA-specific exonuclease [Alteromonadaceae bacterium]|jgi:single-stranded-DNA-specific exonuclease
MQKNMITRPRVDDSFLPDAIHPVLKQIYASRGITDTEQLNTSVSGLLNFDKFVGMTGAVELLVEALRLGKRIIIVGDFDADGATSTAVMVLGLKMMGYTRVKFLVPNRFGFGYGLSPQMAELAVAEGAELIITVDNGISCVSGVAAAKKSGVQVLVTDHHLPGKELPAADAIVNPNQHGCEFLSKNLAGVGVAFYLLLALRSQLKLQGYFGDKKVPNIAELLDLVALGTVADVVQLDTNNRILIHQGLQRIRSGACRPGIKALIEVAGRQQHKMVATDLGFALGPRLNAAGRLDDMSLGISCLLTDDPDLAKDIAYQLDQLNKDRREIEQGMQTEAQRILSALQLDGAQVPDGICLFQADWHQGVIGIVAGRIKDSYNRPTVVFAQADNGEMKGSCRSIVGLHIRDILEEIDTQYPDLIKKFGGHAMAAGLSIDGNRFDTFKLAFEYTIEKHITDEQRTCSILTDGELPADLFTLDFVQLLKQGGPWGQAFVEPVFEGVFRVIQQRLVGEKHLKLVLAHDNGVTVDGIYFNVDLSIWPDASKTHVKAAFVLDINEFRNKLNVQLLVSELLAV